MTTNKTNKTIFAFCFAALEVTATLIGCTGLRVVEDEEETTKWIKDTDEYGQITYSCPEVPANPWTVSHSRGKCVRPAVKKVAADSCDPASDTRCQVPLFNLTPPPAMGPIQENK